jgi:hypothetical protein
MPWKESHVEDESLRFLARLLDGEKLAASAPSSGFRWDPGVPSTERRQSDSGDRLVQI